MMNILTILDGKIDILFIKTLIYDCYFNKNQLF